MTEERRSRLIRGAVNYWLPRCWSDSGSRYRVEEVSVVGDEESGGVEVTVSKGSKTAVVTFTNEECYENQLSPSAAKARVYGASYE